MELDKRTIGGIFLVIGIVLFVGGWFCAANSLGSIGKQPDGTYDWSSVGYYGGITIGIIGIILFIVGVYLLFRG